MLFSKLIYTILIDPIIDKEHQEASQVENLPKEVPEDRASSENVKSTKRYGSVRKARPLTKPLTRPLTKALKKPLTKFLSFDNVMSNMN